MLQEYKYEVAFSFLQEDEKTVIELNDLIKDRLTTFVYFEKQIELAGTDGEKEFNDAFAKDARIVVVLYRDGWGQTSWTRIEETAIRNRGYNEGYDFLFVINLDSNSTLPPWIPKTYLWHNYERFKAENAVAIIEHKVTEKGGSVKKETITDIAERSQRLKIAEREREAFLESRDAVAAALNEMENIAVKVQSIKNDINATTGQSFQAGIRGYLSIPGGFYDTASYSIFDEESRMILTFDNNAPFQRGVHEGNLSVRVLRVVGDYNPRPEIIKSVELRFDRDLHENNGWSDHATGDNFMSSDDLIDTWMKEFFRAFDGHHKRK